MLKIELMLKQRCNAIKKGQFELRQPYISFTHFQDINKCSSYAVNNPTHSSRLFFNCAAKIDRNILVWQCSQEI